MYTFYIVKCRFSCRIEICAQNYTGGALLIDVFFAELRFLNLGRRAELRFLLVDVSITFAELRL